MSKGSYGFSPQKGEKPKTEGEKPFRVLTWNLENLFDTHHDIGKTDQEFLPEGAYRWTPGRYWKKLHEVAKVIAYASEPHVPAIIGLCEVENDTVLTDLTRKSPLRTLGYRYVMTQSADKRGIDVAMLYQPSSFRLLECEALTIPTLEMNPTRDILHAKGINLKRDTLHVFVCHFPSRRGGVQGNKLRQMAATTLWEAIRPLLQLPRTHIIAMGDFNAATTDAIFRDAPLHLTDDRKSRPAGTYAFRGKWQYLDHILISPSLTPCKALVLHPHWLIEKDATYGNTKPRRTFLGNHFHGGVSDHLPLMVDLHL